MRSRRIAIKAPAEVSAGSAFTITWSGPNAHGDWLTIIEPDAAAQAYASYIDADNPGQSQLTAPLKPGNYEVRYVQEGKLVLARRAIRVLPAQ